jgi:RNA polymerase sigma factor (TIGR02999 family)
MITGEITQLLDQARLGDAGARDRFFGRIYSELDRLARQHLARQPRMTMLDPPGLVREAYLRIARQEELPGRDRNSFMAYASRAMRSVIVDYLRSRAAARNGGGMPALEITADMELTLLADPQLESLGTAMESLERVDERAHRVVEMRFFGGMDVTDIADFLAVSPATVKRDWMKARAFLLHAINNPADAA